jgi:hypothetical protein
VSSVPHIQRVQLDPQVARVASMLTAQVGMPRVEVTSFVLEVDGETRRASPKDLDEVLSEFRGHSSEQPEAMLARLAARLRSCFK